LAAWRSLKTESYAPSWQQLTSVHTSQHELGQAIVMTTGA
jgi:hypothetical protein